MAEQIGPGDLLLGAPVPSPIITPFLTAMIRIQGGAAPGELLVPSLPPPEA